MLINIEYLATVAKARGFAYCGYAHTGVSDFGTKGPEIGYVEIALPGQGIYCAMPEYVISDETGCTWDKCVSPHPGFAKVTNRNVAKLLAHPRMSDIAFAYGLEG